MPNTELAEELLQLEEADAWFEYLESTRGQSENAIRRARAVGLGTSVTAAPGGPCTARATSPGGGLSLPADGGADGRGW